MGPHVIVDTWVTGKHKLCCTKDWCCHEGGARMQHQPKGNITCVNQLPTGQLICCMLSILPTAKYVVYATSLLVQHQLCCYCRVDVYGKSLKYTSKVGARATYSGAKHEISGVRACLCSSYFSITKQYPTSYCAFSNRKSCNSQSIQL